ncbi:MAG: ribonuclease Z [Patescibacteria group bacterium]|jgi:ribonuclease BN (tRNA processing enzyme)
MPKIKLTILGCGTMVPTKTSNPAGFLVETANKKILLDAGHGTIRRLTDTGYNIQDIDVVFISHFHTDHFGDAFSLVHSRWVDDAYRHRKHKKLLFVGPRGINKRYRQWRKIFWPEPEEFYPLTFKEGSGNFKFNKLALKAFPVRHVRWFPSVGATLTLGGKKIVYTGDLGSRQNITELIKEVKETDLLIIEGASIQPTANHFTLQQVKTVASQAQAKKTLLVHVQPRLLAYAKKFCRTNKGFIMGRDGLKLTI